MDTDFPRKAESIVSCPSAVCPVRANSSDTRALTRLKAADVVLATALCGSGLFGTSISTCMSSFFPTTATAKHATSTEIGLMFSIFPIAEILIFPVAVALIKAAGTKFVFFTGVAFVAVFGLVFGFVDRLPAGTTFVAVCFTIRIGQAFGDALLNVSVLTIIGSSFPGRVNTLSSVFGTFMSVGCAVGPAIGGILFENLGFGAPFYFASAAIVISAIPAAFVFPKTNGEQEDTAQSPLTFRFLRLLKSVEIIMLSLNVAVATLAFNAVDPILEPFMKQSFKINSTHVGLVFGLLGVVAAMTGPAAGFLIDRRGGARIFLVTGAFTISLAYTFLGPAPFLIPHRSLACTVVAMGMIGFASGFQLAPTFGEMLKVARQQGFPDDSTTSGLVSGLFQVSICLGWFLGPTISPVLVKHLGFRRGAAAFSLAFMLFAVLLVVTFIYLWKFARRTSGMHRINVDGSGSYGTMELSGLEL